MAGAMHVPAIVVLAIVLACIPAPTIAAEFTSGMTIDSYTYFFNVSSYANVSMDVRDMQVSLPIACWLALLLLLLLVRRRRSTIPVHFAARTAGLD
jgi:hypothetical protein